MRHVTYRTVAVGLGVILALALVNPASVGGVTATGGDMTNDVGTFRYHVFTNTVATNFTVTVGGLIDVLIVGGGGGGGGSLGTGASGAGGGAGGLILSNLTVTADVYSVTVGSGGVSTGAASDVPGSNGTASAAFDLTAIGGGGGGARAVGDADGRDGGSGGGVGSQQIGVEGTGLQPGSASGGYGYDGGDSGFSGSGSDQNASGGGGGADGAGGSGLDNNYGGNGGVGLDLSGWLGASDLGDAGWFAGGGGGGKAGTMVDTFGVGGKGGGADGGNDNAVNAMANTGGGGGGAGGAGAPSDGSTGIVIVRYLMSVDLPSVDNANGATNVLTTSACLNGYLSSTGTSETTAFVYWGETDGETNTTQWAHTNTFTAPQSVGSLTTNVTVSQDATYFYRFYAENSSGAAWSEPSAAFITGEIGINMVSDASEGGPVSGTVLVWRAASLTNVAITVGYSVSGTAVSGDDYVALSGSVELAAGVSNTTIVVTPVSDDRPEGPETVVISLDPGTYPVGPMNVATVTVANADPSGYRYVTTDGNDTSGNGSWTNPWQTIQFAVDSAVSGDEIRVGEGLYTEAVSWLQTAASGVTLKGGHDTNDWSWAPATHPSIIKPASSASDVLSLYAPQSTVQGFVLTGGHYGIWARDDAANVKTIAECVISNNTSHGVYVSNSGRVQAQNCLVANNGGNGVYLNTGTGSHSYLSSFLNCTIVGNSKQGWENNETNYSYGHVVRNCLIAGNLGYGVYNRSHYNGYIKIGTTCVHENAKGEIWLGVWSFLRQYGMIFSAYPSFTAADDYHLSSDSPCIDAGVDLSGEGVTTDLEGNTRSAPFDIGCYESVYTAPSKFANTYADAARPDDSGAGTNSATAKRTIGAAAALTAPGGICHAAAGTYTPVILGHPSITLEGAGVEATVVTGGVRAAVWMAGTDQTVRGLTAANSEAGIAVAGLGNQSDVVEQCSARDCTYGIYGPDSRNSGGGAIERLFTVRRCAVSNNVDGVRADGDSSLYAYNVLAVDNTGNGIIVGGSAYDNRAYNCTSANNGIDGIVVGDWHNGFTVRNCIVSGNGRYGVANFRGHSAEKLYIYFSDLTANATADRYYISDACWVEGAGMLDIDPSYAGGGDYHLAYGSPCIGAGEDLTTSGITDDLDGVARTNTYDLGCYESSFAALVKVTDTYVDASQPNDSGAGTNWATAKQTINAAFTITETNGTCHLASGTYTGPFTMPLRVTLEGADRTNVILSGGNPVVKFAETGSTLRNLTVADGTVGIETTGAGARLVEQCVVRNNSTYGIKHGSGDLTVSRCWVTNNTSDGIYALASPTTFINVNSLFADNGGHGVSAQFGVYRNCTFAGNGGDGLHTTTRYADREIRNCLFAGNAGYGVRNTDTAYYGARWSEFYNCCSYANGAGTFMESGGPNIRWLSGNNHAGNPQFVGPGDYHLSDGSLCAGAGADLTASGVTHDLDGVERTSPFDIGCYETAYAKPVAVSNTYVNAAAATDTASGTNAVEPKKTIGSALAITASGGTCTVAAGVYQETIMLPANVTVVGAGQETTIVSNNASGVYWAYTGGTIRELTLCGGLRGIEFYGVGSGTIEDCTLRHSANGIWSLQSSYDGQIQVTRCSVVSNSFAGVYSVGAGAGGGNPNARMDAVNSLFADNAYGFYFSRNTEAQTLQHCTIAGNTLDGYYEYGNSDSTDAAVSFTNCIVGDNGRYGVYLDNTQTDNDMAYSCVGGNLTNDFNGSGTLVFGAGMVTNQSPQFSSNNDYRLTASSPCLDSALDIGVTDDLAGAQRPLWTSGVGSGFDMGAFELATLPGSLFRFR